MVPDDVVSTSMRRHQVASTLIQRHFLRHVPAGAEFAEICFSNISLIFLIV